MGEEEDSKEEDEDDDDDADEDEHEDHEENEADEHGGTDHLVSLDPSLVALSKRALSVAPGEERPLYARVDFLFSDEGSAVVNELELIEPMLFFQHRPEAAAVLADAILGRS